MADVSGFGFGMRLIASQTFPQGISISAFSDDADAIDIPDIVINDAAMGLNGDLITWSKATPLAIKIGVIEGSVDDVNLSTLLEANRTGAGKRSARDAITVVASYPSGKTITFRKGIMTGGTTASSVASSGRIKTKMFDFKFENRSQSGV